VYLQLELVGLSKLGPSPLKVLKDNIPGYQLLHDDSTPPSTPTAP
jgi:LPS-assembly protein